VAVERQDPVQSLVWDAARLIARRSRVAVAAVPRTSARNSHRRSNNSAGDVAS
jgi:hypothetical protein